MKKQNNLQKFDLESINCVESIDNQQAETLTAGLFGVAAPTPDSEFNGIHGNNQDDTNGAITVHRIDESTPTLRLVNLNLNDTGNLFRVTFFDESERVISTLFRTSETPFIKEKHFRAAVGDGATRVTIEQER